MNKPMKDLLTFLKTSAILLLWLVLAFVALNYRYFWQQATYYVENGRFFGVERTETNEALSTPDHISIPGLNIEAPLRYPVETDEQIFQYELQFGVVHYPGTAMPGNSGNVYYFGHSSDYLNKPGDYKTVFALLPKIKKGDEIFVSDAIGKVYRYQVEETFIVQPDEAKRVLDQKNNGVKMLTLQTSYPVGTALRRFIVQATLAG